MRGDEFAWLSGADLYELQMRAVPVRTPFSPPERAQFWKLCERCQTELLVEPEYGEWLLSKGDSAPPLLCPRCQDITRREEQSKPVVANARCVHVDYQRGPFSDLAIVKVDGSQVTVCVLGLGGVEPERQAEILKGIHPGVMHGRRTFHRNELLMRGL
jgi:hypothetical protein